MSKRKTKESSDSANKTSTEPARVVQHGAATRIEAKRVNKSKDEALKSSIKKPIGKITNAKINTTKTHGKGLQRIDQEEKTRRDTNKYCKEEILKFEVHVSLKTSSFSNKCNCEQAREMWKNEEKELLLTKQNIINYT